jgi:hypothetical protein
MIPISYKQHPSTKARNLSEVKRWAKLGLSSLLLFLSINIVHAQFPTIQSTECICLNNATKEGNGQFGENISLLGLPGKVWTVESAIGFYAATSPAPPLNPIPIAINTVIPEVTPGVYRLNGRRIDNTVWNVVVTDGINRIPLSSFHACKYPRKKIIGDFGSCVNSPDKKYSISSPNSMISSIAWSLSGGGQFFLSSNVNPVTVNWGNNLGNYSLFVNAKVRAFAGQTSVSDMCTLLDTATVRIGNDPITALTCNNHAYVSLNGRCELEITPDVILETYNLPLNAYDVVLRDREADTLIKGGRIDMAYINKTIEVKVIQECGGNSCWGTLRIDDKSIPPLVCRPDVTVNCNESLAPSNVNIGYPLPADAIITPVANNANRFIVKNFDYCSDVTLEYRDVPEETDCNGIYSRIIKRNWSVVDISGNSSLCTSRILVLKANTNNVTFPPNYDEVLGTRAPLDACSNFLKLPNGNPDPTVTGSPTGVFCNNVKIEFDDVKLLKCKGQKSYKLIRKWEVVDLCNGTKIEHNQTITVVDKTAPVAAAPRDTFIVTNISSCSGSGTLPGPKILSECSGYTYDVTYQLTDNLGNPTGPELRAGVNVVDSSSYFISAFPSGSSTIVINHYLIDDCENVTIVKNRVTVKDIVPPVPVCDQEVFVAINAQGIGYVTSDAINDGSHDNCAISKVEIQRMNTGPCGEIETFRQRIKFCCEDAGKEIMVILKATDIANNSNTCMVRVNVQDNTPPVLNNCPKDTTINCGIVISNYESFGRPTFTDLCGAKLTITVQESGIDQCGSGSVTRTFTATDSSGNKSTCIQNIFIRPLSPLSISDITWPGDHTITSGGCLSSGILPGTLPAGKQQPIVAPKPCSQISVDSKDLVFQYVDGFCFKILRTWTVIDWCQFNPLNPTVGKFTYTQVIKGANSIAPTITKGCNAADFTITTNDACISTIVGSAEATDDCTPANKITWEYAIDEGDNKTIDASGRVATFSRNLPFGTHEIKYTATDECGNTKSCTTKINIQDTKKPTPICISDITTVLMPSTGSVDMDAKHFAAKSIDNCSPDSVLSYSFSSTLASQRIRTFTCADLKSKIEVIDLNIYVYDKAGNKDFCTVKIRIQDNSNKCGFGFAEEDDNVVLKASIKGTIKNEINEPVKNVELRVSSEQAGYPKTMNAGNDGTYSIAELTKTKDYTIQPVKNGLYTEGVSTLDLVFIQRHILGIKKFDSPYQILAADANADKKITASDLVSLRKLILGTITELPSSPSWTFVDKSHVFNDKNAPFGIDPMMQVSNLSSDKLNMDFIAIKIGDVNASYSNSNLNQSAEPRNKSSLSYQNRIVGEQYKVDIKSDMNNIAGLQTAIVFDNKNYKFEGIESGKLKISEEEYRIIDNKIYISLANNKYSDEGTLFTISLKPICNNCSDVKLTIDNKFNSEIYLSEGNEILVSNFNLIPSLENLDGFELYQNSPNPFDNTTTIGFNLPKEGEVTLQIFDINGLKIKQITKNCAKGHNSIELNAADLNKTGILYYQLNSQTQSSNKKMIVIK